MATYGYARVSSADQNEARQIVALTDAGIDRGKGARCSIRSTEGGVAA